MQRIPCKAKITQVNESKVASFGMDVAELAPRGKMASEARCVTGRMLECRKRGSSGKRRAENQERHDEMCKSRDGCCLEDMLSRLMFADGGWSRITTQTRCPDCAMRVGLYPQPGWEQAGAFADQRGDRQIWTDRLSILVSPCQCSFQAWWHWQLPTAS